MKPNKSTPQGAQIKVSASGFLNIPREIALKLARDLFADIGVDRFRTSRYGRQISFMDLGELMDDEIGEAIRIGLDYLFDQPAAECSAVKHVLRSRVVELLGDLNNRGICFQVGQSYSMSWPRQHPIGCVPVHQLGIPVHRDQ